MKEPEEESDSDACIGELVPTALCQLQGGGRADGGDEGGASWAVSADAKGEAI